MPAVHPSGRRRTKRYQLGSLRVVHGQSGRSGTIVNISEGGALVELPFSTPVGGQLAFDLDLQEHFLPLYGRVVRCVPHFGAVGRVEWVEPASYLTAVEFLDLTSQSATTLREVLGRAAAAQARQ